MQWCPIVFGLACSCARVPPCFFFLFHGFQLLFCLPHNLTGWIFLLVLTTLHISILTHFVNFCCRFCFASCNRQLFCMCVLPGFGVPTKFLFLAVVLFDCFVHRDYLFRWPRVVLAFVSQCGFSRLPAAVVLPPTSVRLVLTHALHSWLCCLTHYLTRVLAYVIQFFLCHPSFLHCLIVTQAFGHLFLFGN